MDGIIDAHYFVLPSQSNIYSLARLTSVSGLERLLVTSLKKKVFCFEYSVDKDDALLPVIKEISFTYIPSGAEIISIDAVNKSKDHDDFVVGITIIKTGNNDMESEKYLNIYSEPEPDENNDFNIDNLANNCLMIELDFVPYFLYHTFLLSQNQVVWFLSGSDSKIHAYTEDVSTHTYHETDIAEHFPELVSPSSIVLWIDIWHIYQNTRRLSVIGCEDWSVKISLVEIESNTLLSVWNYDCDGPISRVQLFYLSNYFPPDAEDSSENCETEDEGEKKSKEEGEENINLLVTSTINQSVVFMNVTTSGTSERHFLPYKDSYDAILSSVCADIDLDGEQEIILGAYSQELIAYKYINSRWELIGTRGVSSSVLCMAHLDLSQDGVRELVVVTMRGIHIFQHDPNIVLEKLKASIDFSKIFSAETLM